MFLFQVVLNLVFVSPTLRINQQLIQRLDQDTGLWESGELFTWASTLSELDQNFFVEG